MEKFVCAFRGRRDSYQVPLALAEGELLDQFITDAYAMPWTKSIAAFAPAQLRQKLNTRFEPGIPEKRVRCLWGTAVVEQARHWLSRPPILTHLKLDRCFSRAAKRRTRRSMSDLLLYSPYAWEAFTARYRHQPRKVLFQYHPHPDLQARLLAEDSSRHPGIGESFSGSHSLEIPVKLLRRERDAWKYADLILCASIFTQRSLLEAGADEQICRVIPYGVDVPSLIPTETPPSDFRAVFVGSGGQRKGLHHLLLAWQRAVLPAGSKLTLICRAIDRGIERMAETATGVELVRGVSQDSLNAIYASSSLFVMPSLVEGFGQVFLEALVHGCPVLGTANTCLPDLGGEVDGIFLVTPGNVDELTAKLETLSRTLRDNDSLRRAARACAAKSTWLLFRERIRQAL